MKHAIRAAVVVASLAALVAASPSAMGMTPGSYREDAMRVLSIVAAMQSLKGCGSDSDCEDRARSLGLNPNLLWEGDEYLARMCDTGDDDACDYLDAILCDDDKSMCPDPATLPPCDTVCRPPL